MKTVLTSLIITGVCATAFAAEPCASLQSLGEKLVATECFTDSARYEVLLPNLSEPVTYSLLLQSTASPSDSLSACNYFIDWQLSTPGGTSDGFNAYFSGTHYRLRDKRLQEYHYAQNSDVFAPGGNAARGVQQQAQFAELLPQNIGRLFINMATDSTYIYSVHTDTVVGGIASTVVEGVRRISGFDCAEYLYVLDRETLVPRRIELENNPGQLGEQAITIVYATPSGAPCPVIDESYITNLKSTEFEKYRESTFSIENLPGRDVPRIAARTADGDRYLHERGQSFDAPTIFVFLDVTVGSTPDVIADVRSAVDMLPGRTDIVWIFTNGRADDIHGVITPRPGEALLAGARGAARDFGVGNVTPVIIFAKTDGTVSDFILGNNQDMASVVIQKASIAR